MQLDANQRLFCSIEGSPVRLLAPAGSGKTLSLLFRCLHLLDAAERTNPKFLVFTFTRAARDELVDRIDTDIAFRRLAPHVQITTLNSFGWKLVKGISTSSRIISDRTNIYFLVQNLLQPLWQKYPQIKAVLEDSRRRSKASQDLFALINSFKSLSFRHDLSEDRDTFYEHWNWLIECGLGPQLGELVGRLIDMELIPNDDNMAANTFDKFVSFWREACSDLRQSAVYSLEDQKYWAYIELDNQVKKGKLAGPAARFEHIFVDEFQDINPLDLNLLKSIAAHNNAQVTIVGDDDQAIYEWRGASPEFILEPDEFLGGSFRTIVLETNYRSPKNIVQMSQSLIAHNTRRVQKQVSAANSTQAHVQINKHISVSKSIEATVQLVKELLDASDCRTVALISRKRSQIIPYQIVFAGNEIPFYAAEDLHVMLSDAFNEMKALLAIRSRSVTENYTEHSPVDDTLKLCDKIKRYPIAKKDRDALRRHLFLADPVNLTESAAALKRYSGTLKGSNEGGRTSSEFGEAILQLLGAKSVAETILVLSDYFGGLQKDYGKSEQDIFYADPPFLYLADLAERYGTDFNRFFRDVDKAVATLARTLPDEDETDSETEKEWKRRLHLMTALRAKGKEFDAVILLDVNDGIWPSKLAVTENQLEQERRVFYVGVTRARKRLYLNLTDSIQGQRTAPSPYIAEMGLTI